ncbi:hypothetical protein [Hydrogenothermus marinus]|uniref:Uncharacterized protein n=1 Tax=Hydrogenothermus marinus TaxID=133270 RepID=A0A3M0BKN7_9AQUI|nr:hypothetical protein [Hydrogenothermus marinus]RMA96994.1 hypothetical protein CLV39_0646 [Hydrogenothermus marinus]
MELNQNQIKELIEDWDWVINYSFHGDKGLPNLLNTDINDVWIASRDKIHDLGLDNLPEVIKLDKQALKLVFKYGGMAYRVKPEEAKDQKRWWWHLDEIAEKKYPENLLPDHLRNIYIKFKQNS